MHYCINSLLKNNNEIMQYCIISNDIALTMHYRALLQMTDLYSQYKLSLIILLYTVYVMTKEVENFISFRRYAFVFISFFKCDHTTPLDLG